MATKLRKGSSPFLFLFFWHFKSNVLIDYCDVTFSLKKKIRSLISTKGHVLYWAASKVLQKDQIGTYSVRFNHHESPLSPQKLRHRNVENCNILHKNIFKRCERGEKYQWRKRVREWMRKRKAESGRKREMLNVHLISCYRTQPRNISRDLGDFANQFRLVWAITTEIS